MQEGSIPGWKLSGEPLTHLHLNNPTLSSGNIDITDNDFSNSRLLKVNFCLYSHGYSTLKMFLISVRILLDLLLYFADTNQGCHS